MNTKRFTRLFKILIFAALIGIYFAFDVYTSRIANEVINTVIRTEEAAIQQGNLLSSISKLEAAIATSESLKGVAVFDASFDRKFQFPLINLGTIPKSISGDLSYSMVRTGLFDRFYIKPLVGEKYILFYFRPIFVYWSFSLVAIIVICFSFTLAYLVRARAELEASIRADAVDSIWRQVSHDIKSPLSALHLLGSRTNTDKEVINLIKLCAKRIEEIVDDLKNKSNNLENHCTKVVEVGKLVSQVISEKSFEFPGTFIDAKVNSSSSVLGEPGQLKRVFSNLINNAIEAGPTTRPIEVSLIENPTCIDLIVKDYGKGIPQHVQANLCKKGFSYGKSGGSGLGLYHARKVIMKMHGKFEIHSLSGAGTTVTISFPKVETSILTSNFGNSTAGAL